MSNEFSLRHADRTPLPQEVGEILFDTLPDALLLLSRGGDILRRNAAAEALKKDIARAIGEANAQSPVVMPSTEGGWMEVSAIPVEAGFLVRIRDITALRVAEDAVRQRDERARLIMRSTNDILWWADPARGFIERQEAWEDFTGQSFEEYRHWGHVAAIHPDDRERVQTAWDLAAGEKRVCTCEYRVYCPAKEEYRHCMAKGVPMLGEDGEIREWIGTLTDIHDLKLAQAELAELNRRLEERVQHRTEDMNRALQDLESLTYTCSHDLRTHLRGVIANCAFLREECPELDDEPKAILGRVTFNALQLAQLVDDLLSFTRLKREPLIPQPVDVSLLLTELVKVYRGTAYQFEVPRGMRVQADSGLMRKAMACLVDNAVKFSPNGGTITFGQRVERGWRTISVRDEGIGFDPEFLPRAFLPFERLHNDSRFSGTGIGLAMVNWIAERHGGWVTATSMPGKGSTFEITLPMEAHSEDFEPANRRVRAI